MDSGSSSSGDLPLWLRLVMIAGAVAIVFLVQWLAHGGLVGP